MTPEDDPFVNPGDTVLENGNSSSGNLPATKPKAGFQKFQPVDKTKTITEIGNEILDRYDSGTINLENSGAKPRRKKVSHKQRAIKYLEDAGYSVTWLEKYVTRPDGFMFKQDWRGLWDLVAHHPKFGELRVNVCGTSKDMQAHIRKFCNDKNIRNFTQDVGNSKIRCALLGFDMQENGRYKANPRRLRPQDIELCLSRKRQPKTK